MKKKKVLAKAKASARKHYVRKKAFEALQKEIKQLHKQLAKFEKIIIKNSAKEQKLRKAINKKAYPAVSKLASDTESNKKDNLTLIKGIGPVLEKKLQAVGVCRFEQIANWNERDIDAFSSQLSFKGRIERERWIQQAVDLLNAAMAPTDVLVE